MKMKLGVLLALGLAMPQAAFAFSKEYACTTPSSCDTAPAFRCTGAQLFSNNQVTLETVPEWDGKVVKLTEGSQSWLLKVEQAEHHPRPVSVWLIKLGPLSEAPHHEESKYFVGIKTKPSDYTNGFWVQNPDSSKRISEDMDCEFLTEDLF